MARGLRMSWVEGAALEADHHADEDEQFELDIVASLHFL